MASLMNGVIFAIFASLSRADVATVPCEDASPTTGGNCGSNLTWAMETGINLHPDWYAAYPELTNTSSMVDFQCVLHKMAGDDAVGNGHDCPFPCTSTLSICATVPPSPAPVVNMSDNVTLPPTPAPPVGASGGGSGSGSMQWWGWCLILGPLLCCIGGILYYMLVMQKAAPKKKKRAVKKVAAPPAEETRTMAVPFAPATTTPVITAPPQYVQTTAVPTTAVPMQMAAPMQYAAPAAPPVYTAQQYTQQMAMPAMAQPMAYAQPATYAAPAAYAAPATAMSAFDMLDANHDGVITRAEFARLGQ